ncbi:MAG: TlpA family protein disulfide reductase [Altibacter sp.]|uniref:TlpA disulfide reductase family protein n=1 Tax=Altibacter sp. TaxID=2024823 RepID=UPI001DA07654|nr:TlpA disulfide reductase family protein [Altibacter sp.]MBZ0326791.1 TlpA family protein disulfide reductase [Altibacter sp.]
MKHLLYTLALMVVFSCAENKKEVALVKEKVPVFNFDELQPLLSKDNDTTYIVNFWATWCKPCVKEMPYFEKINTQYAKDKVKVVFVSLDFPDKLETQVIPFLEKNNIKSQVVLLDDADANSWIPRVSKEWSGAIPATIIYNSATRKFYERAFNYEELENELKIIL